MVLTPHLLAGAAIASRIQSIPLALLIAFFSHFLLDILPHQEYLINKIDRMKRRELFSRLLGMALADIFIGLAAIFLLSKNTPLVYAGAFASILADGANFISIAFPNKLFNYYRVFHKKIHFLENKKIPAFWGIISQLLVVFISILYLL